MIILNEHKTLRITCPVCKAVKELNFPNSIINKASQLTTISIDKGLICDHHFQIFIDKNFKIRGYQKVDYELKSADLTSAASENSIKTNDNKEQNSELFSNLILDGNYLKYRPPGKKKMTKKEIYEEFWDVIGEENEEFQEYILKDPRRKNLESWLC